MCHRSGFEIALRVTPIYLVFSHSLEGMVIELVLLFPPSHRCAENLAFICDIADIAGAYDGPDLQ